jgi:hypothetical protein
MCGWMDEEENRCNGGENVSTIGFMRVWEVVRFDGWIDGRTDDGADGGMNTFHKAVP